MADNFRDIQMTQSTRLDLTGRSAIEWRIYATTAKGTRFFIEISDAELDPERVRQRLDERARFLDGIAAL